MAAGSTYTPLATTTLSSNQTSLNFSSISGSYTDLVLVTNYGTTSAGTTPYIQFNTDVGTGATGYSNTYIYGTGSAAGSGRDSSGYRLYIGMVAVGSAATLGANVTITAIQNYSNTTTYKTVLTRAGSGDKETNALVGLWRVANAINKITIYAGSGVSTFLSGSTFTLYGIAAA